MLAHDRGVQSATQPSLIARLRLVARRRVLVLGLGLVGRLGSRGGAGCESCEGAGTVRLRVKVRSVRR